MAWSSAAPQKPGDGESCRVDRSPTDAGIEVADRPDRASIRHCRASQKGWIDDRPRWHHSYRIRAVCAGRRAGALVEICPATHRPQSRGGIRRAASARGAGYRGRVRSLVRLSSASSGDGSGQREAWRRFWAGTIAPIGALLEAELRAKLASRGAASRFPALTGFR